MGFFSKIKEGLKKIKDTEIEKLLKKCGAI